MNKHYIVFILVISLALLGAVTYPGGVGISIRDDADLEASDMSFVGTQTGVANPYQTDYSDIKAAILGNISKGGLYVSTPALVAVTSGTPIKLAGTTTATALSDWTHTSPGRLTYVGTPSVDADVEVSISMTSSTSNITCSFWVAKNGTIEAGSKQQRKIGTGSDLGNASLHWDVDIVTNDYVEVFVDIDGGTSNITADNMVMLVSGF